MIESTRYCIHRRLGRQEVGYNIKPTKYKKFNDFGRNSGAYTGILGCKRGCCPPQKPKNDGH